MNSRTMKQRIVEQQEVADRNFYFVKTLSLELTRRCNMKCRFCARGDAQNLDMSREIIDKVLDEIEHFDVLGIRLNGGEPFLAKDGILYLVDEIIRRETRLCKVGLFTNGTIIDSDIKSALIRLGEHCQKMSKTPWGQKMEAIGRKYELKSMYDVDAYVSIIISTNLHDNSNIIGQTIDFYNRNVDPEILWTVNQDTSYKGFSDAVQIKGSPLDIHITLRGSALKNFRELYNEGYRRFAIHENEFNLCHDISIYDGHIIFPKSVSVSATGRVFPGCLAPYEDIDSGKDIICDDILKCNGNFFDYLSEYSWQHPLNEDQAYSLDVWKTAVLFYENNMEECWLCDMPDTPLTEGIAALAAANIALMEEFEKGLRELHELFPSMLHSELNLMGAIKFAYSQKDMKIRKHILTDIGCLKIKEGGLIPDIEDSTLEKILDDYEERYYIRQNNIWGNPLPSDALIAKVTKDTIVNLFRNLSEQLKKRDPYSLYRWMR